MASGERIIVIEDEADILEIVTYNLKREGFRVSGVGDGEAGLEKIQSENPDLVLLDLMLPGIDGLELCRKLKSDPVTRNIAVVMLTAKGDESDVVLGLGMGADDYICKPFSPKELVARVKAVLRRAPLREENEENEFLNRGNLTIDCGRYEVKVGKLLVHLTATEFRLLHFLALHPGRVFTRDHLLSRVIGDAVVIDRNIDVHIRSVRKKLGAQGRDMIETIRGVGYRFSVVDSR